MSLTTTVTAQVSHLCPYVDEVDRGTVTLTFDGEASELHDLRFHLDRFTGEKVTHEAMTVQIAELFGCRVVGEWTTAGMAVRTEAVPE